MPKKIQIKKGDIYGKLKLTGKEKKCYNDRYVECVCECGKIKRILLESLRSGKTKSCGCLRCKHKMYGTRIYTIYDHIKQRCTNPNRNDWHIYGGKGIKNLWESFEDFYKDMGESYEDHIKKYGEKETTIDRIDSNGNYCKENCRWATRLEQSNNLSSNRKVVYKGKEYPTLSSLCREYGIGVTTLNMRINKYGLTIEEAIELPLQDRKGGFKKLRK